MFFLLLFFLVPLSLARDLSVLHQSPQDLTSEPNLAHDMLIDFVFD